MIGRLLTLAPWWVWLLAAGALLAASVGTGYTAGTYAGQLALRTAELAHEAERSKALQALADTQADYASRTAQLITDKEASENAAQAKIFLLAADRDRAAAQRDGLLRARDAAVAAARRCTASDPAAQPSGPAAGGDPIGVLADVLGRADARAGELADIADRRLIGWQACAAEYEQVRARMAGHIVGANKMAPPP